MKKTPLIHALGAIIYVAIVASAIFYGEGLVGASENVLLPIAFLSLLVLSVTVMGYLFFAGPIELYGEGKRTEAIRFFSQTVGIFALITILVFGAVVLIT